MFLFSPQRIFLKNERSVLNDDGIRKTFRGAFPILFSEVGGPKQAGFITNGSPLIGSDPVAPEFGSHTISGRALIWPPVKSVIIEHVAVVEVVDD